MYNLGEKIRIIDNFLPQEMFDYLRATADVTDFAGVRNPADGVVYPGISTEIPNEVSKFLQAFAEQRSAIVFMRLSLAGVPVPHQAHTDSVMGRMSMMLYLNRAEHCQGGTSLVYHKDTGMLSDPRDKREEDIWKRDTNTPSAWKAYEKVDMRPNRAFIFPASLMHRAEPIGGFGTDATNGRLVLTMFY